MGAIMIGIAAGVASYFAATKLKNLLGYDDSLDVFGVHAVGGIIGALLTGVFSAATFGGAGIDGSIGNQVTVQAIGIVVTIAYTGFLSWIILKTVGAVIGLRVSEEEESEGLDIALHQESGYNL
jgi:Amt family ammonium transporter